MECPVQLEPYQEEGNMQPRILPSCGHSVSAYTVRVLLHLRAVAEHRDPEQAPARIKCPQCNTPQKNVSHEVHCQKNWSLIEAIRDRKEAPERETAECLAAMQQVTAMMKESQKRVEEQRAMALSVLQRRTESFMEPTDPTPTVNLHRMRSRRQGLEERVGLQNPARRYGRHQTRFGDAPCSPESHITPAGRTRTRDAIVSRVMQPSARRLARAEEEDAYRKRMLTHYLNEVCSIRDPEIFRCMLRLTAGLLSEDSTLIEGFLSDIFSRAVKGVKDIETCVRICRELGNVVARANYGAQFIQEYRTALHSVAKALIKDFCEAQATAASNTATDTETMAALCEFVGHLFLTKALPKEVVLDSFELLLHSNEAETLHEATAEETECAHTLFKTVGPFLQAEEPEIMRAYLDCLEMLANKHFKNFHPLKFQIAYTVKCAREQQAAIAA